MKLRLLPLLCVLLAPLAAQKLDPIKWKLEAPAAVPPGSRVAARLVATMDEGWHLYSPTTPKGGPNPTTIRLAEHPSIAKFEVYQPKPERKFDPNFSLDTETYEKQADFILLAETAAAAAGEAEWVAQVRYQACTDKLCLPPVRREARAAIRFDSSASAPAAFTAPAGYMLVGSPSPASSAAPASPPPAQTSPGFGRFLLIAFGLGLAAVFTPCVFPMIPITMSFFLNRPSGSRADSVFQALVFCLGIIVLFTSLGLATTAALGPFGVVQLGSNPWVNAFITAVFALFAASLLGAFEITLPSGLLTRMDRASQRGGLLGTLLMGLTFSLTSFACVGPFVGSLLAASVQGGKLEPTLGMLSFAAGLASPFFFLALFPSQMSRLPRSGGWLPRVKVVLGFILLAASLKYLSNIDQVMQWNILTRERFLAAWVVLFALPGLYLLGFLRLEGVKPEQPLGVARLLAGAVFLIFAASLVPGMFGGRLGELDAYVPLASSTGRRAGGETGLEWMKNQYDEALARAKQENKRVFVNFTGYACTNCHWMKANMFPRPEVQAALGGFVLLELYTDGTDEASRRNQEFQEKMFSTIAIPYYALVDGDGKVLATYPGLTKDPAEFLAFLKKGQA